MSALGNKQIMATNIRRYLLLTGKTQKEVCKDLGIKEMTFSDWVNAKTYPRIDKIEKLANYFHVQKADLVEEYVERATKPEPIALTAEEEGLVTKYRRLSPEGKQTVNQYVDFQLFQESEQKRSAADIA